MFRGAQQFCVGQWLAGLGKLVQWLKKYKIAGGRMVFCNVSNHTVRLIQLTKLDDMFKIFADEDSAITYVKGLRGSK